MRVSPGIQRFDDSRVTQVIYDVEPLRLMRLRRCSHRESEASIFLWITREEEISVVAWPIVGPASLVPSWTTALHGCPGRLEEGLGFHGSPLEYSVFVSATTMSILKYDPSIYNPPPSQPAYRVVRTTAYQRASSSAAFAEAQSQAKKFESEAYGRAQSKVGSLQNLSPISDPPLLTN